MRPRLTIAAGLLVMWVIVSSLGAYYILPAAQPGVTHVWDDATGRWRLKPWARAVGPFYELGQFIVHHSPLPYKRIGPAQLKVV